MLVRFCEAARSVSIDRTGRGGKRPQRCHHALRADRARLLIRSKRLRQASQRAVVLRMAVRVDFAQDPAVDEFVRLISNAQKRVLQ